jgi:hypothetical protein
MFPAIITARAAQNGSTAGKVARSLAFPGVDLTMPIFFARKPFARRRDRLPVKSGDDSLKHIAACLAMS